jgi:hypothetical protein
VTNPQPSRKRWRITLAVVVFTVAVGWFAAYPAYERQRAIQEIEQIGGWVKREPVGPWWSIRRLHQWGIGVDSVDIDVVDFEDSEVTVEELEQLSRLSNFKDLTLAGTQIDNDSLKRLCGAASFLCFRRLT